MEGGRERQHCMPVRSMWKHKWIIWTHTYLQSSAMLVGFVTLAH